MFLILMQLLKNKDEKKFEEFVKNLSIDQILELLIEAEEYINYFSKDFNNKCEKNDECCLFAILESEISKMLNVEQAKFRLLQKKLKAEFVNNIELQKELEEFFNNLKIEYKEEEPIINIDDGIGR